MSQQGIYETSITLGEGNNPMRPVLQRLCKEHPELIQYDPPQGMSIFVEFYRLTDAGVAALATAISKGIPERVADLKGVG